MQFGDVFQYLFEFGGEIYQNNVVIKPGLLNFVLWKLGQRESPYTEDELVEGEQAILSGALETLDKMINEGKDSRAERKRKEKEIRDNEMALLKSTGKACLWQAIETKQGFYYQCLSHGASVKMEDDVKPTHEIIAPVLSQSI